MALFRDPLREELSWLTTANETLIFPSMEKLPTSFRVDVADFIRSLDGVEFIETYKIKMSQVVEFFYEKTTGEKLPHLYSSTLSRYYDHCMTIDLTHDTKHIDFMLKQADQKNEKESVLWTFTAHINDEFFSKISTTSKDMKIRLKEVADIFGITLTPNKVKPKFNYVELQHQLEYLIKEGKLPILNVELILSLAVWITDYVIDGKVYAIDNISRLKATYATTGLPLYSIVESV